MKQNVKKVCIFQVQAYIFTDIISTISHINTRKELLKQYKWRNEDFGKFQFFFSRTMFQFIGQKFQKENGLKIHPIFHDVIFFLQPSNTSFKEEATK